MSVAISLLRGINVGGHRTIRMEALRSIHESLGLVDVQTYVQSGNVVFRTKLRNLAPLARCVEDAIERSHGFRPGVVMRTAAELRDAVARNPFAGRTGIDPRRLLVMFLANAPAKEARAKLLALPSGPEEFRLHEREIYVYFPNGMARPKLSPAIIEKTLTTPGTGRNWNTVTKLLEMAAELER